MIRRDHPDLSLSRQCRLLSISRSSLYHTRQGESAQNLELLAIRMHGIADHIGGHAAPHGVPASKVDQRHRDSGRRGDVDGITTCIVGGHQDARGVEIKPIADQRFVDPRCEVLGGVDDPEQRVSTLTG